MALGSLESTEEDMQTMKKICMSVDGWAERKAIRDAVDPQITANMSDIGQRTPLRSLLY